MISAAEYTRLLDKGGLLYPSDYLFRYIPKLEDLFISCTVIDSAAASFLHYNSFTFFPQVVEPCQSSETSQYKVPEVKPL